MTDIGILNGIGRMAKERMIQHNLATVEAFNEYIVSHTNDEIRGLINAISTNLRAEECLEGYYPRKHNKRIVDGLTEHIKTIRGSFTMLDYKRIRAPLNKTNKLVINCKTKTLEPYVSYNNSVFSQSTMVREGLAYPLVGPKTQYQYGKSCIPSAKLTITERDRLIRTDPIFRNRRQYKCQCFLSEETCNDFTRQRQNRIINRRNKPTMKYCRWHNDKCLPI